MAAEPVFPFKLSVLICLMLPIAVWITTFELTDRLDLADLLGMLQFAGGVFAGMLTFYVSTWRSWPRASRADRNFRYGQMLIIVGSGLLFAWKLKQLISVK